MRNPRKPPRKREEQQPRDNAHREDERAPREDEEEPTPPGDEELSVPPDHEADEEAAPPDDAMPDADEEESTSPNESDLAPQSFEELKARISHVKKTRAEFEARIMAAWHRSFDGIIEAGRLWAEAKSTLSKDELAELKRNTKFSDPTISKLISIAEDSRITDPKYRASMPSSYGTLYEVHLLTDLEAAIKERVLRPDVEREEIIAFRENRHSSRAKATGPTLVTIWLKQETPAKSEVKSLREALATLIELPSIGFNLSPRYKRLVKEVT